MKVKCNRCGHLQRIRFQDKHKWRIHWGCGGAFTDIKYKNPAEYYMEKRMKNND